MLPEKIKPLAKNVPAKSEWLFGDDLNKRINTISRTNTALTASIRPYYQYDKYQGSKAGSNQQQVWFKTPKFPGGALLKGRGGQQSKATGSTETRQCK